MFRYPAKVEMLQWLTDAARRLREALLATDKSALIEPDEQVRDVPSTVGRALPQTMVAHSAFQAGELAVRPRAIGKEPVAVFI